MKSDLSKLQEVFDALEIAAKVYGLKAMMAHTDKAYSSLANELSRQPGYKLGLSTAAIIIAKSGDMKSLKAFNDLFGCVPVPVPERPWGSVKDLLTGASEIALEFSGVAEALASAMTDKVITAEEKKQCKKEIRELIEACLRVDQWLGDE